MKTQSFLTTLLLAVLLAGSFSASVQSLEPAFEEPVFYTTGDGPYSVDLADLNGDARRLIRQVVGGFVNLRRRASGQINNNPHLTLPRNIDVPGVERVRPARRGDANTVQRAG